MDRGDFKGDLIRVLLVILLVMYFVMLNSARDVLLYSDESKQSNKVSSVHPTRYGDTDVATKAAQKAALSKQAMKYGASGRTSGTSGAAGGSGFTGGYAGGGGGGGGGGGYQTYAAPNTGWTIPDAPVTGTGPTRQSPGSTGLSAGRNDSYGQPPGGGARAGTGGGGGGGWGGGGLVATAAGNYAAPAIPAMPSEEDYLANDSTYIAEKSGIDATLAAALAAFSRDRAAYDADFGGALRNLGWQFKDPNNWSDNPGAGSWREDDLTGAYGAAYNNQQNDFAGRNMMRSSFYGRALEDLLSSFDRQRNQMIASRSGQFNDWQAEEQGARDEARIGRDQARAAAMARRAAMYGIG